MPHQIAISARNQEASSYSNEFRSILNEKRPEKVNSISTATRVAKLLLSARSCKEKGVLPKSAPLMSRTHGVSQPVLEWGSWLSTFLATTNYLKHSRTLPLVKY